MYCDPTLASRLVESLKSTGLPAYTIESGAFTTSASPAGGTSTPSAGPAGGKSTKSAGTASGKSTHSARPAGVPLVPQKTSTDQAPKPHGIEVDHTRANSMKSFLASRPRTQAAESSSMAGPAPAANPGVSSMKSFLASRPPAQAAGSSSMAGPAPAANPTVRHSDFCVKYLLGEECGLQSCTKLKSDEVCIRDFVFDKCFARTLLTFVFRLGLR